MSITFDKAALINAAETALKGHDVADAKWQEDVAKFHEKWTRQYDRLPRVRALRDALTAHLKTGNQPTPEDTAHWREVAGTDYLSNLAPSRPTRSDMPSKPVGWLGPETQDRYRGLIALLKAHVEPTVTANQLKLVGFDRLESLFRMAAAADAPKARKR